MREEIKKTSLNEEHIALGAKMFSFAGWEMPLQYSSIKEEHMTVRTTAGLFDVSHMGQVFISGKDTLSFIQKLVPQDLSKIEEGKALYSMLVNDEGGIIDDLIVYRLLERENSYKFLLIVNASRIEDDFARLLSNKNGYDVTIENKSNEFSMIAVQGPASAEIIDSVGLSKDNQPKKYAIKQANIANIGVLIARTGYTGEDGFEFIVKNEEAVKLWRELLDKGHDFGLKPVGYGARDTLRLEAALLLFGQDMDEKTTPVEASLSWTIPKDKKDYYYGRDVILDQLINKRIDRKLVGFKMLDRSIPRHDYEIYTDDRKAGQVTSGGFSPCADVGIGLGYIDTQTPISEGAKINIMIRGKLHPAEIVKRPFYRRKQENRNDR